MASRHRHRHTQADTSGSASLHGRHADHPSGRTCSPGRPALSSQQPTRPARAPPRPAASSSSLPRRLAFFSASARHRPGAARPLNRLPPLLTQKLAPIISTRLLSSAAGLHGHEARRHPLPRRAGPAVASTAAAPPFPRRPRHVSLGRAAADPGAAKRSNPSCSMRFLACSSLRGAGVGKRWWSGGPRGPRAALRRVLGPLVGIARLSDPRRCFRWRDSKQIRCESPTRRDATDSFPRSIFEQNSL